MPWLQVVAIVGFIMFVIGVLVVAVDEEEHGWPVAFVAVGLLLIFAVAGEVALGWRGP